MKKTILLLSTLIITMLATTMVAFAGSATLKQDANGNWWYYNNDVLDTTKSGMVDYNGGLFVVIDGVVRKDFMGMCHVEFPNVDKWYFFAQGQVQKDTTGFAEYDGAWFYLNKGELDSKKQGFYDYNGGQFLVADGRIVSEYSGLYQNTQGPGADNKWYFLANGQLQKQYTGLALYDGAWFYLKNGCLAEDYTGNVKYNGSTFYVVNGMIKGNGSGSGTTTPTTKPEDTKPAEGKVLNIYVWNEEFKSRVENHYPGYVKVDSTTGTIGDVTVKWNITPSSDNAYQNNLDTRLKSQSAASAGDKVDIFLVETEYADKYVNSSNTLSMSELGISSSLLTDQYGYTHDIMTDDSGVLKGLTWQCCPGALIYNREIAIDVLGTDNPSSVQNYVKDWDTFMNTATKMKKAGYSMTATASDTYRVYAQNTDSMWVQNNKVEVDSHLLEWVDDSKELIDSGCSGNYELWSEEWTRGFYPDGDVFCYFGPMWFSDFSMNCWDADSIAADGGWAVCAGPEGFYWGGSMICVAKGTDNPTLVKELLLTMTTNQSVLKEIVIEDDDFVNSKTVINSLSGNYKCNNEVLGGQNPMGIYAYNANRIDVSNMTAYDQALDEKFQLVMQSYFDDECYKEEALKAFYDSVKTSYPKFSVPEVTIPEREGSVLNIYCWNEEFKSRVTDHHPDYVAVDDTTGKIDDVTVKWIIVPTADNAYQNAVDAALKEQSSASAKDQIDLFLIEPDYAKKYVDSSYTLSMSQLGITSSDIADQYGYTHDIMTDDAGALKGLAWQCNPGALIYNREIAKEVFGTDDPDVIQEHVKDWDSYFETAQVLDLYGSQITSTVYDTYRVYSQNTSSAWVQNGKIQVDEHMLDWAEDSKALYDGWYTFAYDMFSDSWSDGFYPEGDVFCYFGPMWFSDFMMNSWDEDSIAANGGWAVCAGPEGFYWGGTMICAASETDNPTLVKELLLTMTTDQTILKEIAIDDGDLVNSKTVMNSMASSSTYHNSVLGGQNPIGVYAYNANRIDASNMTAYDSGCNQQFQYYMKDYFYGYYDTVDEALADFYDGVTELYPNLSAPQ